MNDYIQKLKNFIDLEYDTQNQDIIEIWRKPLGERVKMGEAIGSITVKVERRVFGDFSLASNVASLTCPMNISKFRVGSQVKLHKGDPFNNNDSFSCEIIKDLGNLIIVKAGFNVSFQNLENDNGYVLDNDLVDIRFIPKGAVDEIAFGEKGSSVFQILNGINLPNICSDKFAKGKEIALSEGMNEMQVEAFAKSYATDNYYLIQGPPGTGKTWVLAHLAHALAKMGQKVLITAFTHRAINNALRKIKQVTNYQHIAKIGQATRSDDLTCEGGSVENFERLSNSPYSNESQGIILGGTCFAVRTSRLKDIEFDTVIFDEAGQVTIPLGIAGMLSGKKYILIGDHMQMPPVIIAEHENEEVTKSVFESLFQYSEGTMLNITYRMNREINQYPSSEFYDNRLIPFSANATKKIIYKSEPKRFSNLLSPDYPSVFLDLNHTNRGVRSPEEAKYIAFIIEDLMNAGIPKEEIAVIAPYRAQGRVIRKTLRDKFKELDEDILDAIVIDTVERIQGQERDVIIISMTTSDPGHASQRAAFYFKPNRLNVALTRPRFKRIVVGSSALFSAETQNEEINKWIKSFKRFYESCTIFKLKKN